MKNSQRHFDPHESTSSQITCYTGSYKKIILSQAITDLLTKLKPHEHLLLITPQTITHWEKIISPQETQRIRILPIADYSNLLHYATILKSLLSPRTRAVLFVFPFEVMNDGVIQELPNHASNSLGVPRVIGLFLSTLKQLQISSSIKIGITYDVSTHRGKKTPWTLKLLTTYQIPIINLEPSQDEEYGFQYSNTQSFDPSLIE